MNVENSENKEVATTGDNGVDDDNNNTKKGVLVAEDPNERKDINSVGTDDVVDNNNIVPLEGGENQGSEVVAVQGNQDDNNNVEVILALADGDISMEIAATTSNIQDTIGEGLVAEYDDNVLRMQPARFPDGQFNFFTTHARDTVGDINSRLGSVFGNDAIVLGFIDGDRVIRATPTSIVDEIIGNEHIRLAFGFGNEMADDGD